MTKSSTVDIVQNWFDYRDDVTRREIAFKDAIAQAIAVDGEK